MMEFTHEDLRKLIARHENPCVSIYTPMHIAMPEALHNPAPFKKLLSETEKQLTAAGYPASEITKLVQPGRELLADYGFWQQHTLGLVVFLSLYGFYPFRLPIRFAERLVIGDRFFTKPLLPLMHGDGQYFILAFSQHEVRFLQATKDTVRRLDLKDIPTDMANALQYDKLERQLQLHTYVNQEGTSTGVFHTQGAPPDVKKEDIAHFVEILAKRVSDRLKQESAPLVLVSVEYMQPMFRGSATYAHTTPEGLHGNPETLSDEQLHQQTWSIVEPLFIRDRENALKRYREGRGTNQVSTDVSKVVPSAYYGAVDTLFVEVDAERWGKFDPDNNLFELHTAKQEGDIDLLNAGATQTILNSGVVFGLPRDAMPDPNPIAAVFRYPV